MADRVFFFVDGFNVYHSLTSSKTLRNLKWLDLPKLCQSLLNRTQSYAGMQFFTAIHPVDPKRQIRHRTYLQALELCGVQVVYGEFKRKDKYCKNCNSTFVGYEEKQTDVNIAIELFKGAVNNTYDTAAIVSGDSDLIPAIRAVKTAFPAKNIMCIFPPSRSTDSLKQISHFYVRLKEHHITKSQLPDPVIMNGATISKPSSW